MPIDTTGKLVLPTDFEDAEDIARVEGEEAFLEYVIEKKIENHLTSEYRAKLEKMKNR